MDILIRQARIVDPHSPLHFQTADLFIQNGTIAEIGSIRREADKTISADDLHVSLGWTDCFAQFCDPGFEYRETLETGSMAAAAGGFANVMLIPNTSPVVHNKSGVEYLIQNGKHLPVNLYPIGAVTRNTEGKELAEMYDMHRSGAVAFGDGLQSLQSPGVMMKALQYLKAINKTVIQLPDDRTIGASGLMNEGVVSTGLGLPGKPALSEELMVRRDIELSRYTSSRLHITGISTAISCSLIRQAKAEGLQVTCSVTPYHLYFHDGDLAGYDTNLKVNPPLRTKADRAALRAAMIDGTIDCMASHHIPLDDDHKIVEFEYAQFGMTGLQTSFATVRTALPELALERTIQLFTGAARLFDIPQQSIEIGNAAVLTLFQPDHTYIPGRTYSRSRNNAMKELTLSGNPLGIINRDQVFLNQF